ncbi:MAG: aminotransferase class I/II-fold pyridoxal phosphate-dependent enzyme [Gammaproteobacteria bacterium]|nr:aminotransferase class I/II-fold pyridoxal phosphate-dependent enzyme [Gammaproteobacteria bacterium]
MKFTDELINTPSLEFSMLARQMNISGDKIISLGLGEPGFQTPSPIIEALFDAVGAGHTRYTNSNGLYELRQKLCDKFKIENSIQTDAENIVVTPGSKQAALLAMMAILEPGDEVINLLPCYVSYIPQLKLAEPTCIINNIDVLKNTYGPDWNAIYAKSNCKTKLIVINTPNNPTGYMFSEEDVWQLVELLKKYPRMYVLSDEVYEYLNFSGKKHLSIGSVDIIKDRVVTVNGFSKSFSMTGWRLGYLNAPPTLIDRVGRLQQHINTNTATFIQKAGVAALSQCRSFLKPYNRQLRTNYTALKNLCDRLGNIELNESCGGLFAFINISKTGLRSDEFCSGLLQAQKVATTPGVLFGENWDCNVRISLAAEVEEFQVGINALQLYCEGLD